jgi:hypothetical protein
MQEDVAGRKEVKKKEAGSRKQEIQVHIVLTLGLDQIIKFIYCLDRPLGEGNVQRSNSECVYTG